MAQSKFKSRTRHGGSSRLILESGSGGVPGRARLILALGIIMVWAVAFGGVLVSMYRLATADEGHSHLLAMPILIAYFIHRDRKELFTGTKSTPVQRVLIFLLLLTGAVLLVHQVQKSSFPGHGGDLSLSAASAVLILAGILLSVVGRVEPARAIFPGLLLLLCIPIPPVMREKVVAFLVRGSSDFTEVLFHVTGTSFYREGTMFALPGVTIEVADACSGIRSSIGFLLTLLVAGHILLVRWWSKGVLLLTLIPLVLVKNGIRIATLTLLAVHVDKAFLTNSPLHSSGGVVFFAIALIPVFPILMLLRRLEDRESQHLSVRPSKRKPGLQKI